MYTKFYDLQTKPFQISSDPSFIWLGEKHQEALATLKYGVKDNKGLMLLTGDVGTGKTTVINTLIESLGNGVYYASIPDPQLDLIDFLNYIAQAFHIDNEFESKGSFLLHFGWFLESAYKMNKKVLLIIDEAQLLTQSLLEEIRLLSNINRDMNHLLNIFFVGQNEFNEILHRPENRAVKQRITLNYQLQPLTLKETELYIRHRLKVAGGTRMLFSASAIQAIAAYSEGIPRKINVLCDQCLLTGFTEGIPEIDTDIVADCAKDIEIPHYTETINHDQQSAELNRQPTSEDTIAQPNSLSKHFPFLPILMVIIILGIIFLAAHRFPEKLDSEYRQAMTYMSNRIGSLPKDQQQNAIDKQPKENETLIPVESDAPIGKKASIDNAPQLTTDNSDKQIGSQKPSSAHSEEEKNALNKRTETTIDTTKIVSDADSRPKPEEQKLALQQGSTEQPKKQPENAKPALPELPVVIRFESNSNDFNVANLDKLDQLARAVKNDQSLSLNISGYTDSVGSEQYNAQLSLFRANMIKSYLLGQGVPESRLIVYSFGSRNPVANNTNRAGKQLNRRVEVMVIKPNRN